MDQAGVPFRAFDAHGEELKVGDKVSPAKRASPREPFTITAIGIYNGQPALKHSGLSSEDDGWSYANRFQKQ